MVMFNLSRNAIDYQGKDGFEMDKMLRTADETVCRSRNRKSAEVFVS